METLICIDCGKLSNELSHKGRCMDCAAKIVGEVARQMAARDGPYYEKWLLAKQKAIDHYRASMEKAVKRYAETLDMLEHDATPEGQAELLILFGSLRQGLDLK